MTKEVEPGRYILRVLYVDSRHETVVDYIGFIVINFEQQQKFIRDIIEKIQVEGGFVLKTSVKLPPKE